MDIQSASVIAVGLAIGLGQATASNAAIFFNMFMSLMVDMPEDVCDKDDSEFNDEANLVSIVDCDDLRLLGDQVDNLESHIEDVLEIPGLSESQLERLQANLDNFVVTFSAEEDINAQASVSAGIEAANRVNGGEVLSTHIIAGLNGFSTTDILNGTFQLPDTGGRIREIELQPGDIFNRNTAQFDCDVFGDSVIAAGLNACLNQIERLIASSEVVLREDIENSNRFLQEFEAEFATLGGRVDDLESRTALPLFQDFVPTVSPCLDTFTGATGFFADQAFDPSRGNGLFNGDFAALGQITVDATDNIQLAATYVRGYFQNGNSVDEGIFDLNVGTENARRPLGGTTITTDSVGLSGSWTLLDSRLALDAFGLWTQANATTGSADQDIWSYGLGVAFPDLGKEGNLGGSIASIEDDDGDSVIAAGLAIGLGAIGPGVGQGTASNAVPEIDDKDDSEFLEGEVVFGLAQTFDNDNQAVFQDRVRLNFVSSFTGRDSFIGATGSFSNQAFEPSEGNGLFNDDFAALAQSSQEQLARDIGVAVSTIRRWEREQVEPTMTVLQMKSFCEAVNHMLDEDIFNAEGALWQDFVPTVSPYVDFQELRELLSAIAETDITEFTLKSDDFELTLRSRTITNVVDNAGSNTQTAIQFQPIFPGLFPGRPLMPEVPQIEAMAQVGGTILMQIPELEGKFFAFTGIDKVRFRRPVTPGDQLIMTVELLNIQLETSETGDYEISINTGEETVVQSIPAAYELIVSPGQNIHTDADINGDGFDDLIVGVSDADEACSSTGEAYVVFGSTDGSHSELDLRSLDGSSGLTISSEAVIREDLETINDGGNLLNKPDINTQYNTKSVVGLSGDSGSLLLVFRDEITSDLTRVNLTDFFDLTNDGGDHIVAQGDVNPLGGLKEGDKFEIKLRPNNSDIDVQVAPGEIPLPKELLFGAADGLGRDQLVPDGDITAQTAVPFIGQVCFAVSMALFFFYVESEA